MQYYLFSGGSNSNFVSLPASGNSRQTNERNPNLNKFPYASLAKYQLKKGQSLYGNANGANMDVSDVTGGVSSGVGVDIGAGVGNVMMVNGNFNTIPMDVSMATPLLLPMNTLFKPIEDEKTNNINNDDGNINNPYENININFNGLGNGMEFLSMAAGVTAKDKRIKDAKNQAVVHNKDDERHLFNKFSSEYSSFYVFLQI